MGFILGVDPGSRTTGWAILQDHEKLRVVDCGIIKPPEGSIEGRLAYLYHAACEIAQRFPCEVMGIETPFTGINIQSALTLAMARGVIIGVVKALLPNITLMQMSPKEAKKALTGQGSATKEQIQKQVAQYFSVKNIPSDAADAVAIALFAYHQNLKKMVL